MAHDPRTTKPEAKREGDIDDDRQDAPSPPKTSEGADLDGLTSTPGDKPEGDDKGGE